jgi:aspartyl-tRNA(Asn)/glutamyl-tRNA(Gln) amidotransferase subunit B
MRDITNAGAVSLVEQTVMAGSSPSAAKKWWLGEVARRANAAGQELDVAGISPEQVARIQILVEDGLLTDKMARTVIEGVMSGEGTPDEVVAARGLGVVSDDSALLDAVERAIAAQPDVAEKIRGGKTNAVGALIGAVMKDLRGQADAAKVRELLLDRLG